MEDSVAHATPTEPQEDAEESHDMSSPAMIEKDGNITPPVPETATTPIKTVEEVLNSSSKASTKLWPMKPSSGSPTPQGKRFRTQYEEMKTRYAIQQQTILDLKNERDTFKEKLSECTAVNEELKQLKLEMQSAKENYETIIASKNELLEARNCEIKDLQERQQVYETQNKAGLHRVSSDESIFRLKPGKKKKQATGDDKLACEFEGCSQTNTDLIRCNVCYKWVCGDCHDDIPVAKFKPLFNKCRTLYFLCKSCDQKVGIEAEPPQEINGNGSTPVANNLDLLTSLQRIFDKKVTQLEKAIDKKLEDKMAAVTSLNDKITGSETDSANGEKVSYAKVLQVPAEVRKAMQEARNDEKIEKSEQEKRSLNFIIHGAEEIGDDAETIKKNDEEYIKDILKKLGVKAEAERAIRLGQPNEAKMRTLKIVMKTEAEKEEVMGNLRKLKGTEWEFGKISVTRDYSSTEREKIKEYAAKAKAQGEQDPTKIFKVRGDPKNGLRIISYKRK